MKKDDKLTIDDTINLENTVTMSRVEYHHKNYMKKLSRLRPWAFWLLLEIFLITITTTCLVIFSWFNDDKEIKDLNNKLDDNIKKELIDEEGTLKNPPLDENSDYWYYITFPFYSVNFTDLQKKNNDTIAFIHMDNTNINYPVVQANDNKYYLSHAFDKSENEAGWVFTDYRNNSSFTDFNTIIYGHGRINKTVFGSLKNVLTSKWQSNKDNYTISISTPTKNYLYQIFSIYTIEKESYYIKTNFLDSEKASWLTTMKERNTAPITTSVTENDQILTLSTCENNNGGRIVVHAKLIKEIAR